MKKLVTLIFILIIGIFILVNNRIKTNDEIMKANELKMRAPIEIPDSSIKTMSEVNDKKPILAFFYVDWCGYCRRFMPIFGEVAKQYKDKFNFVAVHCEKPENEELVKEYEIRSFPSLFIIDNRINYRFPLLGSVTRDEAALIKELNNYLSARKHFAK